MAKDKRITKRFVDSVKVTGKDQVFWDGSLTGFGFRVSRAGHRAYILQYRFKGQSRRMTLGEHGPTTAEEARSTALQHLGDVERGIDPAALERAKSKESTVADALVVYLDEVTKKKAKRTADEYARLFGVNEVKRKRTADPALAPLLKFKVSEVTRELVAKLHTGLHETPYLANRALATASAFFTWCEKRGYRPIGSNPCRAIDKYEEQGRERFLSVDEMTKLGAALIKAESEKMTAASVAAIRFLMLSGFREQEALTLKWSDIDEERGVATLSQSKTGKSIRHLGAPAMQLLSTLKREQSNPHVFPGVALGSHLSTVARVWAFVKKEAELDGVRLHDLRHSYASVAVSGGMSLPIVGALLGHRLPSTTQKYAHLGYDPRKLAAEKVSTEISAAMRGDTTAEVKPIKKSARHK